MNKDNNNFFRGTLVLTLSAIILKIIGVVYKIPLSYILGDEGMGYFNSAYTIYTFFYIIGSAGIPKAITILVSKSEAESADTSRSIRNQAFLFFSAFSLILFFSFVLLAGNFSKLIANEKSLPSMYAVAPSIIFVSCGGVLRGYYGGKLKFSIIAISEVISGLGKLIIGLALAYYAANKCYPTHIISAYTILGISIGTLLSLLFLLCFLNDKKQKNKNIHLNFFSTIKSIVKIAIPITISSAVSGIATIIDLTLTMRGLINKGYSPDISNLLYGNYTTLALPMFGLISALITQISTALIPNLTRYYTALNKEKFLIEAGKALKLTYFIIIPSALLFLFFPYEILGLLFDKGSVSLGYILLSSLSPSILLLGPLTIMNTALEATGNINKSVISLSIGAVFKLIISGILINLSNIGIYAAPISTFLSYLLSIIISSIFIKRTKIATFNYLSESKEFVFPALISIAVGIPLRILLQKVEIERLKYALLLVIMGGIYLVLSLLLSKKARKYLINFVKTNKNKTFKL